ncbi:MULTISPECIES: hypothetical protein [Sandaracinus]|uniref:hypothetical protein n=1 Tax=Sandaracinus TaxID=1055688 RepID=UPI0019D45731|nr:MULTISPECIES: hypothetical protein [Sandaracinus]QRN75814.1 Hypothetical protein MSR10575_89010 [Sandaracinus sp.]UJR87340.1 Hypothetical protein I5071_1320 [Sandaracinus amylolyticus]
MIGAVVMTLAFVAWTVINGAIAIGRPIGTFRQVKVLAIFTLLPQPWDRVVGAGVNVLLGLFGVGIYVKYVLLG